MPITPRGNSWILVLTDHFTRWADALAIPDASVPTVARVLDQNMFCYFGLPEQLHSDQGAQFQSQLLSDLCRLWEVNKSWTTPYHPQGNGVVERNNRMLGDSLRSLLLNRGGGQAAKLQPKFVGPYAVVEVMPNHTYRLERLGQVSVQNEARLKPYWASPGATGEAPLLLEPRRQTAMRVWRRRGPEYEMAMP